MSTITTPRLVDLDAGDGPTTPRGWDGKPLRKIEVDYDLGVDTAGTHHYAVLSASFDQGGINYWNYQTTPKSYTMNVRHETSRGDGLRGWTMGDGAAFARSEPVARFNRKQLERFFDEQFAGLGDFLAENPKIAKFFELRGPVA